MAYYARRVKRKCEIRGCKNTDCFAISKSREPGNSVIMCGECIKAFALEVDNVPVVKKKTPSAPPPLFFGDALKKAEKDENKTSGETVLEDKSPDIKTDGKKKTVDNKKSSK